MACTSLGAVLLDGSIHRVSLSNVQRTIDDIWVVMGKKEGKAYLSLISQMKGLHPVCACVLF